jgi:hypothetical protein
MVFQVQAGGKERIFPLKHIVLSVPADFEAVAALLARISRTSFFGFELDVRKKNQPQNSSYQIMFYNGGEHRRESVGLLEVMRVKKKVTKVTIREPYVYGQETRLKTGSLMTRFISVFAQNLMCQGISIITSMKQES